MPIKKIIIFSGLAFVLLLGLFVLSQYYRVHRPVNINLISLAGQKIAVDVAIDDEDHTDGLSGREKLEEDRGMLFVFDESAKYPFWMKDMKFSLDIIWLDENREVVYIKEDARPESYPDVFEPMRPSRYVLEVPSGFSKKNNLKIGDQATFYYSD